MVLFSIPTLIYKKQIGFNTKNVFFKGDIYTESYFVLKFIILIGCKDFLNSLMPDKWFREFLDVRSF